VCNQNIWWLVRDTIDFFVFLRKSNVFGQSYNKHQKNLQLRSWMMLKDWLISWQTWLNSTKKNRHRGEINNHLIMTFSNEGLVRISNLPVEVVLNHGDCGMLDILLVVGQTFIRILETKQIENCFCKLLVCGKMLIYFLNEKNKLVTFPNLAARVLMMISESQISSPLSSTKGKRPRLERSLELWATFYKKINNFI